LILNSPFNVQENSIEFDILSDSSENIVIENIEHFPPFEVNDTCTLGRHNFIFKEFVYVIIIKYLNNFFIFLYFISFFL